LSNPDLQSTVLLLFTSLVLPRRYRRFLCICCQQRIF